MDKDLELTASLIKAGKVVILPTDTVYAVAADVLNEEAVENIYKIKKRDFSKPCNILVSNIDMIRKVTYQISDLEERIIKSFFPGALTIIFNKNSIIPDIVTSGLSTVGIRMPDDKFLLELIDRIGRPIVATSLNLSGEKSMTNVENIPQELKNNIDLIVNSGEAKVGTPSTIIRVENNKIEILREGPITKEDLEKV